MEEKEFNNLYLNYKDAIVGYIYKRVKIQEVSEDITHDVFTKFFIAMKNGSYQDVGYIKSYLYTLAHNETINYLKSYTYLDSKFRWNNLWLEFPDCNDIHECYCAKETLENVINLINTINIKNNQIFHLRYFECMKYEEIAKKLGIPVGTIKWDIFAMKKFLQSKGCDY